MDQHIDSTLQHVLASRRAFERLRASVDRANEATDKSREAIRQSKALLSTHAPQAQPPISPEQQAEQWRIAANIVRILKEAGYGCELSVGCNFGSSATADERSSLKALP